MSIAQNELVRAYLTLQISFQKLHQLTRWETVETRQGYDTRILRIVKRIQQSTDEDSHSDDQENELAEDDAEVVDRQSDHMHHWLVVYDIVHSPSYRVPVLYVTFKPCPSSARPFSGPTDIDKVYEMLTPTSFRPQMQSIGVMGALSMTDHPVTGTAAYFVHPCRTAEAMKAITGDEDVGPQRYLLIWIGLVGQSVGLEVPSELAEIVMTAD